MIMHANFTVLNPEQTETENKTLSASAGEKKDQML